MKWGKQLAPCQKCVATAKKSTPAKGEKLPPTIFPQAVQVTIWTCSDGAEFTGSKGENEALWHELELTKKRLNKGK